MYRKKLHKEMRIQNGKIEERKKELIANSNLDFETLIRTIQENRPFEEKPEVGKTNREVDFIITSASRPEMIELVESFQEKVIFSGKFNWYLHEDVVPGMENGSNKLVNYARKSGLFKEIIVSNPRQGRGPALNKLKKHIKTDYIFYTEEDFRFMRYINVDRLIDLMETYEKINQIGFANRYWPCIPCKPNPLGESQYFYEPRKFDEITLLVSERWLWFPALWRRSFIWKYWNFSQQKTNHDLNRRIKGTDNKDWDCNWLEATIGSYLLDGTGEDPWVNAYLYHLCPKKRHDRNFL